MASEWRWSGPTADVLLLGRDGAAPQGATLLPAASAAQELTAWLQRAGQSGTVRAMLAEMAAEIGFLSPMTPTASLERFSEALMEALLSEALRAFEVKPILSGGPVPKPVEPPKPPEPPKKVELTWISIELVDDDTPSKPVPQARYRIELPDFSVREGRLDATGKAKITGIEPGTCKVTFPEFDQDVWEPI